MGALSRLIDNLSMEEFQEVPVRRITPNPSWPYPHGIHTLNGFEGLSVIDAKRHTWPPELILKRFWFSRRGRPRPRIFRYTNSGFQVEREV
jgi:hypothetical protein